MGFSAPRESSTASRSATAWRPSLGNGAHRDIRRAHEIAKKAGVFAFKLHGVTWITRTDKVEKAEVQPRAQADAGPPASAGTKRQQRSEERREAHAALMKKARDFRARSMIHRWSRDVRTTPSPAGATTSPTTSTLSSAYSATTSISTPPNAAAPPAERREDERAPKRGVISPPVAESSPVTPRAKRTLTLQHPPPGTPPPSIPPSPPSTTSTSPPSPPSPPPTPPTPPPSSPSLPSPPPRMHTVQPALDESTAVQARTAGTGHRSASHWLALAGTVALQCQPKSGTGWKRALQCRPKAPFSPLFLPYGISFPNHSKMARNCA